MIELYIGVTIFSAVCTFIGCSECIRGNEFQIIRTPDNEMKINKYS